MIEKIKPRDKPHYVNNRQFSYAVVDYVTEANSAKGRGDKNPVVPDYIAICFMKICEGLSHKPNLYGIHTEMKWLWMELRIVLKQYIIIE